MKKIVIIILILITLILVPNKSNETRIRIIANSDSTYDQNIKLIVANEIANKSIDLNNLRIIKEDIEYILRNNNCSLNVDVSIVNQNFQTKYYDNKIISGGKYKTLVIKIGQGKGKNYWSILYPEYNNASYEKVNSGDVEYRWFIKDMFKGD